MKICRHYIMTAKVGSEETVIDTLKRLGAIATTLPGFLYFGLMQDRECAQRVFVVEDWERVEDHQNAFEQLPKADVELLFSALQDAPQADYLDYIHELEP
jgi:heme-degrading monooxygenase HmoA